MFWKNQILIFFVLLSFLLNFIHSENRINVHIVLNSHNDLGWGLNFDEYFYGTGLGYYSYCCVTCSYDEVLESLSEDPKRTFTTTEMIYLFRYIDHISHNPEKTQKLFKLIENKQLVIGQVGLSINDHATSHYDDIIDQMTYGYRKVFEVFHLKIEDGWAMDVFGVSFTYTYIMRKFGFKNYIFDRVGQREKNTRTVENRMEIFWGSDSFLTHILPYLYGTQINAYKKREDLYALIELNKKTFPNTKESLIILSDDFKRWEKNDFKLIDEQMQYYKDHPELNVNMFYSTASNYFKAVQQDIHNNKNTSAYSFQEDFTDFLPLEGFADQYWVGFYTTHSNLKFMVSRFGLFSRSLKNMLAILMMQKIKKEFISEELRKDCIVEMENHVGFLAHHDTVTGTLSKSTLKDVIMRTNAIELTCRKRLEKENNFLNTTFCNLMNKSNACIFDLFQKNSDLEKEFRDGKKIIAIHLFNPIQTKKDIISLRIPDLNMMVKLRNGTSIESDSFCEKKEDFECFLHFEMDFHGFSFVEILLEFDNSQAIKREKNEIELDKITSFDLRFEFDSSLTIGERFSKFTVSNSQHQKTFSLDYKYYESKKMENCHFYSNSNWEKTCNTYREHSGVYAMKFENEEPYNFKDEMTFNGYHYKTKFFTRIIITYDKNSIISKLTFYKQKNVAPKILVLDVQTFVNDNLLIDYSRISGKELTLHVKLDDLKNKGTFFTDSNGLFMLKRQIILDSKNPSNNIPRNYYPVVSQISINNKETSDNNYVTSLYLFNDRAQGGTSFREGEIELMIQRYINSDDDVGLCENIIIQEKLDLNHIIVLQTYEKSEKQMNEQISEIMISKNFLNLFFVNIEDKPLFYNNNEFNNSCIKKRIIFLEDIPNYMKINLHPIRNNKFLIRVQDLYHENNDETYKYFERIRKNLMKDFNEKNECYNVRYNCIPTLMPGLSSEEENLWKNENIEHDILTMFCQEILDN